MSDTGQAVRSELGHISRVLDERQKDLLRDWMAAQSGIGGNISESEFRAQLREFLHLLRDATAVSNGNLDQPAWRETREFLADLSRTRARQGFTPSDTAMFVFSLKEPLIARLREEIGMDADGLAQEMGNVSRLLDALGLYTVEVFQRSREEIIARQQQDMLELSTPVVSLWDGILALPMIGTLDSARTQVVMEALLQRIVERQAAVAIIDITGVPTVDTLTAQHLLKTITAARLMGAECIISGIRPQIAQTIVHLGVDLGGVTTKASLADAFRLALQRTGRAVVRAAGLTEGMQESAHPPRT